MNQYFEESTKKDVLNKVLSILEETATEHALPKEVELAFLVAGCSESDANDLCKLVSANSMDVLFKVAKKLEAAFYDEK